MKIRIQKGDNSLDVAAKMAMERLYDQGHTVDWVGVQKYTVDGKRITLAELLKMAKITVCLIALMFVAGQAMAQQRTIYDRNGKAIGQETIDTQGTRTLYGSDGKAISRESKGTVYDAESGRVLGKITKDPRK